MANLTIRFFSNSLKRYTSFQMFIPNDFRTDIPYPKDDEKYLKRGMKTLFLLHGYTGDAGNWMPEYIAQKYNFAVVCPNGENSFYVDGGASTNKYATLVGEELVNYVRKTFNLAKSADDTYIMGMSMGGFGSLYLALRYPETFGKTAPLSSALILYGVSELKPGEDNGVANYDYYVQCFGDPAKVLESDKNPEVLVKKLLAEGKKLPEIFMACGTEDFLLEPNRRFHKFLEDNGVKHVYMESKGQHDMIFWHEYAVKFAEMMFGEKDNA